MADARPLSAAELLAIRRRLGLSQPAMARALGVHVRTLGRWERGEQSIPGPVEPACRAVTAEALREAG